MKLIPQTAITLMIGLFLAGCSDSTTSEPEPFDPNARFEGLRTIGSKDAFTQSMREALVQQFSRDDYYGGGVYDIALGAPEVAAAPSTESDAVSQTDDNPNVTGTNVQEIGVDESDRIKSDGEYLYVLKSAFQDYGGPFPVEPGLVDEATAVDAVEASSIAPYYPPSQTQVRILSLDSAAATSALVKELTIDTGNEFASGMYLHQEDGTDALIVTSSSLGAYWGYWHMPEAFIGQKSTIRKVDISSPAEAGVVDSLTLDGQIISSRRIGKYLYVASRFFPRIEGVQPYVTDKNVAIEAINNADIEELLPSATRASDNSVQALADANNCFVAQKPDSGYYSPDIITLAVIDLGSMSISDSVCYLGATETLYASTHAVYLATTQYNYAFAQTTQSDVAIEFDDIPVFDPRISTDIHQFNINQGQLTYVGSGAVEGHLGWNELQKPFRMSEKDGYLRVATYSDTQNGDKSPVLVSILKPGAGGKLELIGKLPNSSHPAHIGKPQEQLHASRFLGDRAYLVTFRQTDPLYVIDLANAEDPRIAGELQIDGYSEYLHPIDENYLLGIGKGAIPATVGSEGSVRGAFEQGVKVSLFDVSNPASPQEVESIEIGKRGTQSSALQDHHGITVQRATAAHPTRLTFGIDVHDIANAYSSGPSGWYDWHETGLFAFEIQTGNNAGISQQGKMIVETASQQQTWGPQRNEDRSVIVDDTVFYIHGEQVFGANWNSLNTLDGPR